MHLHLHDEQVRRAGPQQINTCYVKWTEDITCSWSDYLYQMCAWPTLSL